MRQLTTELKVGLFTLLAMVVLGYIFFVLSPDMFQANLANRYFTVVKDAAGIVEKTQVKTNGVVVGQVTAIKLEVNQTRIEFEIKRDVKIPLASVVTIKEKGLLGDVFMEIVRGEDSGTYIEDGGFIPPAAKQFSLSALMAVANDIGFDIKEVTATLKKVFGGQEGEKNLADIVGDIRSLASNLRLVVEENRQDVRSIVSNIEKTSAALRSALGDKEGELIEIVANIKEATDELRGFSQSLSEVLNDDNKQKIDQIIAAFDNTMQDVEVTAKNVRLVADKIEKGEGTIGKLVNEEKMLSDLQAAINDVREVLAPATKLQLAVDYHGELRKDKSTQHYFNTYLRTRPDKFYVLGFTDLAENQRRVTTEEKRVPGSDEVSRTERTEISVEKKAIRFNLQFAKRWHFAQLRFGLFESTGGLASDFFLFDDKLRLSFEAFDWNSQSQIRRTAHLKAYASVLFFKHIYALVGLDDPSRYEAGTGRRQKTPNYFVGAGLSFDDKDLKAIFGTAALAL